MNYDLSNWPEIDLESIRICFPEVALRDYPRLSGYSRSEIHEGLAGQGGLFLASDMAGLLSLRTGMKVLDLGCGSGTTSIFLARNFGVTVYAFDKWLPDSLSKRAEDAGVGRLVIPVRGDAGEIPFPKGYFDNVFCMNSFFYFGTNDLYPSYLLGFLRNGGELVIGSPCYRDELGDAVPEEFLIEFPACLAVHSPSWWSNHFAKTRMAAVLSSELHPRGHEFWADRVRFLLEQQRPADMEPWMRDMIFGMIRLQNRDADGFVSHFMLHAKKT